MLYTAIRSAQTGKLQRDSLQTFITRSQRNAYLSQEPSAIPLSREEALSAFGTATVSASERLQIAQSTDPPAILSVPTSTTGEATASPLSEDRPQQARATNPHKTFKDCIPSFQGFRR